MARTGICRLNDLGVNLLRRRYREGRFVNVAAFCRDVGMPRSTYYELAGRTIWFEHDTVLEKLQCLGIAVSDVAQYIEFREEHTASVAPGAFVLGNLPHQPTSFVGREKEIAAVSELVTSNPLITLTGAGGCGKTRLALQIATGLVTGYRDGAWVIEPAAIDSPEAVIQTALSTIGVIEEPGCSQLETLTTYLASRSALIVLDNCEHLISACASVAAAVLRCCKHTVILATSRAPLSIAGEIVWRVPPLKLPESAEWRNEDFELLCSQDAVRLFVERAHAVCSDFALTPQNGPVVAQLCSRLDGMPLAIELAAARINALSVDEINARLDGRFRLLTTGARTALPRQKTLRALMDWSYDQLTASQQACLNDLSVFAGGWTLAAAESVCSHVTDAGAGATIGECDELAGMAPADLLDIVTSLIDNSLVLSHTQRTISRYGMHETVRQYARDRLEENGERGAVRGRHLAYFTLLVERASADLRGARQGDALSLLDEEYDNIRAAYEFALTAGQREFAMRMCNALSEYWLTRGLFSDGREWCRRALSLINDVDDTPEYARTLRTDGRLADAQWDFTAALQRFDVSLAICRRTGLSSEIAGILLSIGEVQWHASDYELSCASLRQSLDIYNELGDVCGAANALRGLGAVAFHRADYEAAFDLYAESLSHYRKAENQTGISAALNGLGNTSESRGKYDPARAYYEESLAIRRDIAGEDGIAQSLCNLAILAGAQGDYAAAQSSFESSLAIHRRIGNRGGISFTLNKLGTVAQSLGKYAVALKYFEESLAIRREIGDRRGIASTLNNIGKSICREGRAELAKAYFEESLEIGRAIGNKNSMAASLEGMAGLAQVGQNWSEALRLYSESLIVLADIGDRFGIAGILEAMADLASQQAEADGSAKGMLDRAVCLWAAADAARREIGSPLPPAECERYHSARDYVCSCLGLKQFQYWWSYGGSLSHKEAIAYALGLVP